MEMNTHSCAIKSLFLITVFPLGIGLVEIAGKHLMVLKYAFIVSPHTEYSQDGDVSGSYRRMAERGIDTG